MTGCRRVAARAVTMALGARVVGVMAFATPAAAGVTVTPSAGIRGDAVRLVFQVSDERAGAYTTQVDVDLPGDAVVAEVYPLTVPDWAPKVTMRKLEQPVETTHGGRVTEVASRVTWTRAPDAPVTPNAVSEVAVTMGPLPDADKMVFTAVQTYSDGTVVRWADPPAGGNQPAKNPAPVLRLLPPASTDHAEPADPSSGGFSTLRVALLSAVVTALALCIWFGVSRLLRAARASRSAASPTSTSRSPAPVRGGKS